MNSTHKSSGPAALFGRAALLAIVCVGFIAGAPGVANAAAQNVYVPAGIPAGTPNDPLPDARAAAITFSGINVSPGDLITITATGLASGGPGFGSFDANGAPAGSQEYSGPVDGGEFPHIVGPAANIYSLVGTIYNSSDATATLSGIGDEWFLVGTSLTLTADRAGELAFLFDDALYRDSWTPAYLDNSGGFNVQISVQPSQVATTTSITSSANPSILGDQVTFKATVAATTVPTGAVQWQIDGQNVGAPTPLDPNGTATYTTSSLGLTDGTTGHTITASYTGDTGFEPSSAALTQQVAYAPTGTCDGNAGHVILQPINADGTSVFKAGSTVPAKFRVCDALGNSIGINGVVNSFRLTAIVSGTNVAYVDEAVSSTNPDSVFRWDPSAQQWTFNISTNGMATGNTYYYTIALNDGSQIQFHFGLR